MNTLKIENLSCGYGGDDVVRDVTLAVAAGEKLCVMGPNGCGKSTLLKAVAGVLPYKGGILLDRQPLHRKGSRHPAYGRGGADAETAAQDMPETGGDAGAIDTGARTNIKANEETTETARINTNTNENMRTAGTGARASGTDESTGTAEAGAQTRTVKTRYSIKATREANTTGANATHIAWLGQTGSLYFSYSVFDTVLLGRFARMGRGLFAQPTAHDREVTRACLQTVGLAELSEVPIDTLSGGQLQRVFLARTFAQEPDVILLDEPTNHLDLAQQLQLMTFLDEWVREPGCAVVGVLHDVALALRFADRIAVMDDGRVRLCAPPEQVLKSGVLSEVFQTDVGRYLRELAVLGQS
ncbi:MAG: ABC transporter ATP-binding protein [Oscillospiraceae bacterium]|nr:ABC transporter ATP-binding protein [Oscillospiraceae bacterium]